MLSAASSPVVILLLYEKVVFDDAASDFFCLTRKIWHQHNDICRSQKRICFSASRRGLFLPSAVRFLRQYIWENMMPPSMLSKNSVSSQVPFFNFCKRSLVVVNEWLRFLSFQDSIHARYKSLFWQDAAVVCSVPIQKRRPVWSIQCFKITVDQFFARCSGRNCFSVLSWYDSGSLFAVSVAQEDSFSCTLLLSKVCMCCISFSPTDRV